MRTILYKTFHILLIILIVLLSGCKVFKSKQHSKLETKREIRKDSAGLIIDKSVTTVKEKIDTSIVIPEKIIKQDTYLNMDSLVNGMTAIQNDIMNLRLVFNPVTGVLSAEAKIKASKVPVHMDRETRKQNDLTQQSNTSEDSKVSKKQESGSSIVKKDPVAMPGKLILIAIIIASVGACVFWIKKRLP